MRAPGRGRVGHKRFCDVARLGSAGAGRRGEERVVARTLSESIPVFYSIFLPIISVDPFRRHRYDNNCI